MAQNKWVKIRCAASAAAVATLEVDFLNNSSSLVHLLILEKEWYVQIFMLLHALKHRRFEDWPLF